MNELRKEAEVIEAEYVDNQAPVTGQDMSVASNQANLLEQILSQHHGRNVPKDVAVKIIQNAPFNDVPADVIKKALYGGGHARSHDEFLRALFSTVMSYGLDTDAVGFEEQAKEVAAHYPQNPQLLKGLMALKSGRQICSLDQRLNEVSEISVLPSTVLADLLCAAPVVYADGIDLVDESQMTTPGLNALKRYIASIFRGRNLSDFFQMHNIRNRPLAQLSSKTDIMPIYIAEAIEHAKQIFDAVLILTPYHRVAVQDWQATAIVGVNRDPYLIGINYDGDQIFQLGRWVGSSIFPNFFSMVQNTISNLQENKALTSNIPRNFVWAKGVDKGDNDDSILESWGSLSNTVLPAFCDRLLEAFDQGRLFDFLRS